ncbi:hypothetical protein ACTXT7_009329 [Hymenolepis weldensis]
MFEILSTEIRVLSAGLEDKMSPDVSYTFTTTVSPNSFENSIQFLVPVSPKGLPTATLVRTVNDKMKLHPSVRDSVPDDFDIQIWVSYLKNLRSWYATLISKPKTFVTEIYLDACCLPPPWNPDTPETQHNHRPDIFSVRFRRPRK